MLTVNGAPIRQDQEWHLFSFLWSLSSMRKRHCLRERVCLSVGLQSLVISQGGMIEPGFLFGCLRRYQKDELFLPLRKHLLLAYLIWHIWDSHVFWDAHQLAKSDILGHKWRSELHRLWHWWAHTFPKQWYRIQWRTCLLWKWIILLRWCYWKGGDKKGVDLKNFS